MSIIVIIRPDEQRRVTFTHALTNWWPVVRPVIHFLCDICNDNVTMFRAPISHLSFGALFFEYSSFAIIKGQSAFYSSIPLSVFYLIPYLTCWLLSAVDVSHPVKTQIEFGFDWKQSKGATKNQRVSILGYGLAPLRQKTRTLSTPWNCASSSRALLTMKSGLCCSTAGNVATSLSTLSNWNMRTSPSDQCGFVERPQIYKHKQDFAWSIDKPCHSSPRQTRSETRRPVSCQFRASDWSLARGREVRDVRLGRRTRPWVARWWSAISLFRSAWFNLCVNWDIPWTVTAVWLPIWRMETSWKVFLLWWRSPTKPDYWLAV